MHVINANGAAIPALGFGTWTLRDVLCAELVAAALGIGYRHVDTAAIYGNEAEVGRGLRAARIRREDIFLTTKVWYTNIAPGDLERSVEASLQRLDVDYVDLVLIHWPNPGIPLDRSIRALNAVRGAGLARHIGVSNFSPKLLREAVGFSDAPLVCNQIEHHPYLDQSKVLAACRSAGMAMVSYCPLFRGGDLLSEPAVSAAAARHGKIAGAGGAALARPAGGRGRNSTHHEKGAAGGELRRFRLRALRRGDGCDLGPGGREPASVRAYVPAGLQRRMSRGAAPLDRIRPMATLGAFTATCDLVARRYLPRSM